MDAETRESSGDTAGGTGCENIGRFIGGGGGGEEEEEEEEEETSIGASLISGIPTGSSGCSGCSTGASSSAT